MSDAVKKKKLWPLMVVISNFAFASFIVTASIYSTPVVLLLCGLLGKKIPVKELHVTCRGGDGVVFKKTVPLEPVGYWSGGYSYRLPNTHSFKIENGKPITFNDNKCNSKITTFNDNVKNTKNRGRFEVWSIPSESENSEVEEDPVDDEQSKFDKQKPPLHFYNW
jgi:hypothetical protein